MEYYILGVDSRYSAPTFLEWRNKINGKKIAMESYYCVPNFTMISVAQDMQTVFTDIIVLPCFMVSKEVKNVIQMYSPSIEFERIILLSKQNNKSVAYYKPCLERVDCLTEGTEYNKDRSVVRNARLDKSRLVGKAIVQADAVNCTCVIVSMDLANSLLRRETLGIGLQKTICV